ncbi:hypothetical protein BDA99DRAFT_560790 [Phascolomyces articulosus]|uniref:Zn(2)-C6 fungal-type domain-containing protein n=1 Tax=Phascolomyces articulosus TaxID=60185 RepID=A0AAD5JYT1_9FUNG|nr:hypothetical protein BDA99DRAFT_560790 [Phascolomyces articulosus]
MHPTSPCKVCRLRRRKCVWSKNASTCDRCAKLELECLPTDENKVAREHEELMPQDGDEELERWHNDVNHLELELHKMETLTGIHHNASGQWASALTTLSGAPPTPTDSQDSSHDEPQWQMSVINGHFRLETAIQSIDELKLYTEASLRYLSPFGELFNKNIPIQFESTSISISVASQVVIQRHAVTKPRKVCFAQKLMENNDKRINQQYKNHSDYPCPLVDYRSIVEYLVPLYIKHKIPYSGGLHVPSFRRYYDSLADPLSNPVILAICVDALVSLHQLVRYSAVEGRLLAEVLYYRCKEMLFDMYDDPTRRLEVIMVTSFLQSYVMDILLNYAEARRLVTVALLACSELEGSYMKMTPVERILYQRHRLVLEMANRTFDIYFEGRMDYRVDGGFGIIELEALDDELDLTKQYVRLYNQLILLVCTPHVSVLLSQINRVFYGEPCKLYLEDIISFQPIILDWWKKLPSEFRLYDDPFDNHIHKLLEKRIPSIQLFPLIAFHMLTGIVTASLLQPKCQPADASQNNPISNNVLQSLHKELASLAKNSNKVMIYILKKNWGRDESGWSPSLSFCMVAHILYIFDKLSNCPDVEFPIDLLNLFKKILHSNIKTLFPPDHQLPQSNSLLATYLQDLKNDSKLSPLEVYEQYPFPGYAQLNDIIFSSLNQLDQYVYPSPTITTTTTINKN